MSHQVSELLGRYVSNTDRNVYTITNLPEEVIAVIFAYVSRSQASFRDNLVHLLTDQELAEVAPAAEDSASQRRVARASEHARKFHEKWVVGYGHSSVAEHGVVHVGIERISRLASAALELANPFLSFTEYSQRYQRPGRDRYVLPAELDRWPVQRETLEGLQHLTFDAYERIEEGLFGYLAETNPPKANEDDEAYRRRIGRLGFEDARYVLTLATETNLGMTANGRALRDGLIRLLGDAHMEVQSLAAAIEQEAAHVLPTLLRHIKAPLPRPATGAQMASSASAPTVRLLAATGDHDPDPLQAALTLMVGGAALVSGRQAPQLAIETYRQLFQAATDYDLIPDEAHQVSYRFQLQISEATWHQLLRHVRRITFVAAPPGVAGGVVVPPTIRQAGLEPMFRATVRAAEKAHAEIAAVSPEAAHYAVTNAHRRLVEATVSLGEMAHLMRVRGAANAQWEIRDLVTDMAGEVDRVHPGLLAPLIGSAQ
ncbi:MAG: FAD-dependent thymidylate synthase [Sulfobacillus sp.]